MSLVKKITAKQARVGVIGLGYVGLPLVIEFCRAGFTVTGFDVDEKKIASLRRRESYIRHIDSSLLKKEINGNFTPTTDFKCLAEVDCILICVPTPLDRNREPDMRYVFNTTQAIAKYLRPGQLVVLESTTYPGTTDGDMRKILEADGMKAGRE